MNLQLRPLTPEYVPAFRRALSLGFGFDNDLNDQQEADRFLALFAPERAFPVFDGDELISTGANHEFQVTVPGGAQVSMAGLTIVTVRPTHTRRGVLTMMMEEHFRRARTHEDLVGGLWASEVPIYGRFGYGSGVQHHEIKFDARIAGRSVSEPGVTVRLVDEEEAETLLPDVFAAAQPQRPGVFQRSLTWWRWRKFHDPEKGRNGASALRHAVAFEGGKPVGYVSYRQKGDWGPVATGEVRISELVPATDAAYRALWGYVSAIDLFPIVKHWNVAPDDPLWLLFENGRAVETTAVADSLWVRLIDVPAALEARTYSRDGSLVIRVVDDFCGWNDGTYRLSVDGGRAECTRVVDEPDVGMAVDTLGALYLGGRDAAALGRAGRIEGVPERIEMLSWLFRSSPEPWCPEIF